MNKRERQTQLLLGCREAAPPFLDALWITITHAPDQVFPDIADLFTSELPCADTRLRTVLGWISHGHAEDVRCPICWMLVGRLVYTIPEPVARLGRAVEEHPTPAILGGAALFLSAMLEPRHARPAGVERDQLDALVTEVRGLAPAVQKSLVAHWVNAGRSREELARRFSGSA